MPMVSASVLASSRQGVLQCHSLLSPRHPKDQRWIVNITDLKSHTHSGVVTWYFPQETTLVRG